MDPLWAGNIIQLVFVLGLMVKPPGPASQSRLCLLARHPASPLLLTRCRVARTQVAWTGTYVFRVFTKQMTYAKQLDAYEEAVMRKRCACRSRLLILPASRVARLKQLSHGSSSCAASRSCRRANSASLWRRLRTRRRSARRRASRARARGRKEAMQQGETFHCPADGERHPRRRIGDTFDTVLCVYLSALPLPIPIRCWRRWERLGCGPVAESSRLDKLCCGIALLANMRCCAEPQGQQGSGRFALSARALAPARCYGGQATALWRWQDVVPE